ncbi:MAG: Cyclic di-GMP phosphodiesterase response regulator RpfG [Candidatus Accumulibacter adjunctus]|uniref:Cyclic di-GMP phosphodiesterase response regulator RpfG n=1 Tax=Candidatus Accumulibacter adjunctus TaxID=1454001 RepID=A0A011PR73_9PROT|nr:MAG: Cyclic di-GMP phosphodiesterase response regulator RpfG [Candidatus Accumulibacter adjunctus]
MATAPARGDGDIQEGEIAIVASQLRPGVHVRLPVPWMQHQFLFSSFVIADEEQVRLIAAMRLPELFCDPRRCRVEPLPRPAADTVDPNATAAAAAEEARLAAVAAAAMAEKQERSRVMQRHREGLDKAQKLYFQAATTVSGALRDLPARPQAAVAEVLRLSADSTAALLGDTDSALVLIAERAHDDRLAAHSLAVMTLALLIGKQAQIPPAALPAIASGALLHDIGKLQISPSILRSSERNRHEEAIYQSHGASGHAAAKRAGTLAAPVLDAIRHHHERCDGRGFPDRLSGSAIPLTARIVAIANRFDNLVNPLEPGRALSPSEALSVMWTRERPAFDEHLLQFFIRAMGVYPPGSIVRLTDGRIAAVVAAAAADKPLLPTVMVYTPEIPRQQSIIIDLARIDGPAIERALRLQERSPEELDYLLPRRRINWCHLSERRC